ncbi:MAG TPA: hypothetical protein EYG49_03675 [Gammaproteobacteria bacterium]|jgi:carbamoyltransferase|nr:hypothetical protein [Gammaproteobacteria bacterium]
MNQIKLPKNIPQGSVVGLNYSGMHDTAMALVSPDGEVLFALSLERLSRVKQDGRCPNVLLEGMPWNKISTVALSVAKEYQPQLGGKSKYHQSPLSEENSVSRGHEDAFMEALSFIPVEKKFIEHHLSHAASAFWLSGFSNASCLVYDGGMANEDWFGGVYDATQEQGVTVVDQFNANKYSNIAHLYTAVTVLLGFSPLKHEGKITGLAAYGVPQQACIDLLEVWLADASKLGALMAWENVYDPVKLPALTVNSLRVIELQQLLVNYSREDIAATIQHMAEEHVMGILKNMQSRGDARGNLCLAGGLFANVKINQRASELGFNEVFVAPPMSDDGSALGAALHVVSSGPSFKQNMQCSMFLGSCYSRQEVESALTQRKINYQTPDQPAIALAKLLAEGNTVAVFQGASEFGPRSLGGRSILANADDVSINADLNKKLNRTEFMPFAPMCLEEDAHWLFKNISKVKHAAEFMTVTVECSDEMAELCPAVVHCDKTARPQLVSKQNNALIYDALKEYKKLTSKPALVNTSFNVHEEPIVLSPNDAIKGFFETGLDALFIEGCVVKLRENTHQELEHIRAKLGDYRHRLSAVNKTAEHQQDQINAAAEKADDLQLQVTHLHEKSNNTNKELDELAYKRELQLHALSEKFERHQQDSNELVLALEQQILSLEAAIARKSLKGRVTRVFGLCKSIGLYYRKHGLVLTFKHSVGTFISHLYLFLVVRPWLWRQSLRMVSAFPFVYKRVERILHARGLRSSLDSQLGVSLKTELGSSRARQIWQDLSEKK